MSWRTGRRDLPPKDPGGPPAKFLPPAMYALFRPRPPLEFVAPQQKRKMPPPSGIAAFTSHFEKCPPPKRICSETVKQRHVRLRKEKNEKHKEELKVKTDAYEELKKKHEGDAYKTLFVARIAYDVTEKKLRREFERFGPIKNITMIKDEEGNPRGYSFIQYESEKCMRDAYKRGDGTKLNGRRVLVDVERGRTVRGWKPRKLGGGLGDTRGDKTKRSSTSGRATSSRTGTSSRGGGSDRRSSTGGGDRERRSGTSGGGDRDRRSGGDRDRGRGSERDRGARDSSRRSGGGGDRDRRGGGDRDRRSGGDRDRGRERTGDRERTSDRRR